MSIGPEVRLTNEPRGSTSPEIAWNGHEYAVVWTDESAVDSLEIYFARGDFICR